jgi:hypothetical protein
MVPNLDGQPIVPLYRRTKSFDQLGSRFIFLDSEAIVEAVSFNSHSGIQLAAMDR